MSLDNISHPGLFFWTKSEDIQEKKTILKYEGVHLVYISVFKMFLYIVENHGSV